ncbi:uncharacterized protein LOC128556522 isoform X2 [Mercenaria mercenaria]|uniref:uncharacterized protein LOC128556522 isoform X2 n=1 Tax=Mercenaria mercenaria TaxID=6596 RepID=UPI00234EAC44|nr:uncharacterized protein LOC128556522 isoform X2 [Mercenaria mercenaria]
MVYTTAHILLGVLAKGLLNTQALEAMLKTMSAKNSAENTEMDIGEQRQETDTGNDKHSVHDQQSLNHPSGLHPAKIRKPTAGTSNLGNGKQNLMDVAFDETEETSRSSKKAKVTSKAVTEVAADNGFKNEDLKPPSNDTAGVEVEADQDWPNNSEVEGSEPENTSGARDNYDLELGIEPQKNDVISNTQVAESLNDNNNTPPYTTVDDHQSEIIQRPESSGIRKRRHEASVKQGFPLVSTATAKDNDKSLVKPAVGKAEIQSATRQKLLAEVVEKAEHRKRRSIQETNQQEQALEISATEDVEQVTSTSTSSPDRDYSLSPEASNDVDRIAQDKCQTARQSCIDMDYTAEQIDMAVNEYHKQHGGSDDYSGCDLALLIMETRQDEVHDGLDEPSPPPDNHNPSSDSIEQANMAVGGGHYKATATVTDHGHPDDSTRHTIRVDVPLKRCDCGCVPKISVNSYFP